MVYKTVPATPGVSGIVQLRIMIAIIFFIVLFQVQGSLDRQGGAGEKYLNSQIS